MKIYQILLVFLSVSFCAGNFYKFLETDIMESDIIRKTYFRSHTSCLMTCVSDSKCNYVAFLHDPEYMSSVHCLLIKEPPPVVVNRGKEHQQRVFMMKKVSVLLLYFKYEVSFFSCLVTFLIVIYA